MTLPIGWRARTQGRHGRSPTIFAVIRLPPNGRAGGEPDPKFRQPSDEASRNSTMSGQLQGHGVTSAHSAAHARGHRHGLAVDRNSHGRMSPPGTGSRKAFGMVTRIVTVWGGDMTAETRGDTRFSSTGRCHAPPVFSERRGQAPGSYPNPGLFGVYPGACSGIESCNLPDHAERAMATCTR